MTTTVENVRQLALAFRRANGWRALNKVLAANGAPNGIGSLQELDAAALAELERALLKELPADTVADARHTAASPEAASLDDDDDGSASASSSAVPAAKSIHGLVTPAYHNWNRKRPARAN